MTGCEPPGPDGKRNLPLIIALEIDDDEERLRKMELGTLMSLFDLPFPILLWDRTFGNFSNDVNLKACLSGMCIDGKRAESTYSITGTTWNTKAWTSCGATSWAGTRIIPA